MKTSLIIPFRNEVECAESTMSDVFAFLTKQAVSFELIAVDDSVDGTWEILSTFASAHENVIAIKGGTPPGYGKALKTGFEQASGDILITFNGDQSDSLEDVIRYIELIEQGNDMVFGSRYLSGSSVIGSSFWKSHISRMGNRFLQFLFHTDCCDITNSFKAYRKEVIEDIGPTADGYEIVIETPLKAIRKNYKCQTIPVSWEERLVGQSKMALLRTIRRYLYMALRIKFSYKNK